MEKNQYNRVASLDILSIPLSGIDTRGFVCVEVLRPSKPNGVISSAVSLPKYTFTGQA